MWKVVVGLYRAFKYTVYFLLIMGILSAIGCPFWWVEQITELEQISPFDEVND